MLLKTDGEIDFTLSKSEIKEHRNQKRQKLKSKVQPGILDNPKFLPFVVLGAHTQRFGIVPNAIPRPLM